MKFIFDFRFCYLPTAATEEEATSATNAEAPLLSYSNNSKRDTKHNRPGSGSAIHWRPALSAIAENAVVSFADGQIERKTLQHEKKVWTKGKFMAKACVCYGNNNDNKHTYNRDNTMHVAIPGFSPTPFTL
uniref:Uncharacterized protein n=2 Tax=Rhizophora mucronata TaxID=61149 RepID=A0A2P2J413_RHIMU